MTVKQVLEACRKGPGELRRLHNKLDRLVEGIQSTGGMGDGSGVHGTAEQDRMAAWMCRMDDCEGEIAYRERRYSEEKLAAITMINCLDEKRADVMYRYYVGEETVVEIGNKLHYTQRHVRRVRDEALEEMEGIYTQEMVAEMFSPWYNANK